MPNTSTYGFDYESPTSLPGTTLTGGPTATMPVLAVQVDAAIASLAGTVSDQASTIGTMQTTITTIQNNITNLTNWTRRGTTLISFTTQTSFSVAVNFGFTFPDVPTIMTNIDSGSGSAAQWNSRAITATTTGFTMFVFYTVSNTWVDIPVSYIATYRA